MKTSPVTPARTASRLRSGLNALLHRRLVRCAAAAFTALLIALPCDGAPGSGPGQRENSRPNFLVLLTDDQRYDDLGCSGNAVIQTPHLDSLARRGVRFRNFFVTSSVCMASRASYFTGRVERSHGCNFYYGEHGLSTKFYLHENSVRVPLMVFDPRAAAARAGAVEERLTANIDVAPTILELAGLPVPAAMQGWSLVPLLRGESVPWRDAVFLENLAKERRPMCDGLRTTEWKYIVHFEHRPVQEELYRLTTDPDELENLAGQPAYDRVRTELSTRLQELRVQYSGLASGFPEWIATQKENTANWEGYRAQYLKLKARGSDPRE